MLKRYLVLAAFLTAFLVQSCSKKNHPGRTSLPNENSASPDTKKNDSVLLAKKNDSLLAKNAIVKRKEKVVIPKVISVNDSAARKSVDGRYYYDVMGHRYWRNNKDGKYYLFNKSMYNNDAFKAPGP